MKNRRSRSATDAGLWSYIEAMLKNIRLVAAVILAVGGVFAFVSEFALTKLLSGPDYCKHWEGTWEGETETLSFEGEPPDRQRYQPHKVIVNATCAGSKLTFGGPGVELIREGQRPQYTNFSEIIAEAQINRRLANELVLAFSLFYRSADGHNTVHTPENFRGHGTYLARINQQGTEIRGFYISTLDISTDLNPEFPYNFGHLVLRRTTPASGARP